MRNVFRLADQEIECMTRTQGEKLRNRLKEIHAHMRTGDQLAIDFSDVQVMTPSFADECFGKLAESLGPARFRESVSLVGATKTIRALVNAVLAERLVNSHSANQPRG